jgi:hypothetical protein
MLQHLVPVVIGDNQFFKNELSNEPGQHFCVMQAGFQGISFHYPGSLYFYPFNSGFRHCLKMQRKEEYFLAACM